MWKLSLLYCVVLWYIFDWKDIYYMPLPDIDYGQVEWLLIGAIVMLYMGRGQWNLEN